MTQLHTNTAKCHDSLPTDAAGLQANEDAVQTLIALEALAALVPVAPELLDICAQDSMHYLECLGPDGGAITGDDGGGVSNHGTLCLVEGGGSGGGVECGEAGGSLREWLSDVEVCEISVERRVGNKCKRLLRDEAWPLENGEKELLRVSDRTCSNMSCCA